MIIIIDSYIIIERETLNIHGIITTIHNPHTTTREHGPKEVHTLTLVSGDRSCLGIQKDTGK